MHDDTLTANSLFTEKITHLKQRVLFKDIIQFVLYALCFFLLLHGLVVAVEKSGLQRFERGALLYLSLSAVALFTAAGVLYIRKISLLHLLIGIDERLGLQDRLSSAYECHLTEKESIFSASLLEDAGRSLRHFGLKELLPLNFSRLYLALALVAALNLLLLFVEGPAYDMTSGLDAHVTEQELGKDAGQAQELKKPTDQRLMEEEKAEDARYKKLREKAEELRQKNLSPQEQAQHAQAMLQEVQSMQEGLMDPASLGNESTNIENMPVRQVPQQQKMMMSSLQNIEDLLQSMLSEDTSGASKDSQELSDELQKQLSDFLEELDGKQSGSSSDSSQEAQEKREGDKADGSKSAGASADNRDTGEENGDGGEQGDGKGRSEQQDGRMSEAGQEGDMREQGQTEGNGFQASAGSGPGDGEEYPPSDLETSAGPVQQDNIRNAEPEEYNVHIRSVTEIGKAGLPEENLTRPYRREVESVLQQEEMPLNYREYIKNYFLSIGLTEE